MPESLAIVGAGRVGRTLARSLRRLGWRIGAVVTRSPVTARAAVRAIGGGEAHAGLTPRVSDSAVILIATPDSAVSSVAAQLARVRELSGKTVHWRRKVVLHTSGALDSSALAPLARRGAATGSIHPMQTFSGRATPRFEGVLFGLEGGPRALRASRRIALCLGGVPVRIRVGSKPAYHAAGGFAAPHLLCLMEAGTRLLMAQGFRRRQATRALLLLARQSLDNLERLGPRASWTGPLSRGDYETIVRHMAALRKFPREYPAAYSALTRLAARLLGKNPRSILRRLEPALRPR